MTPHNDGKPRRMKMRKLTAVALTQQGANPHADVTFMKSVNKVEGTKEYEDKKRRKRRRSASKSSDLNKRFAILSMEDGHQHLIDVLGPDGARQRGYTSYDDDHSHEWVRREDGTIVVLTTDDHSHEVVESVPVVEKSDGYLVDDKTLEKVVAAVEDGVDGKDDDMTAELTAKNAELEKKVEAMSAIISLPANQRAYFDGLNDSGRADFLGKSLADRAELVKQAESADEVVYTTADGDEIRKSQGAAILNMAKRNDELTKKYQDQELVKRVADDIPGLAGTEDVHKELLRAVDGIKDEDMRKKVNDCLKASSSAANMMTKTLGTTLTSNDGGDVNKAEDSDLMTAIKSEFGITQ